MPSIKYLSLEEKIKIPVRKLPLSKEVKEELIKKSVYSLKQIVDKFNRAPGRCCLPGFKTKVYLETRYLLIKMGFPNSVGLYEEDDIKSATISYEKNEDSYRETMKYYTAHIIDLKEKMKEARKIDRMYAKIKTKIDSYVNNQV